MKPRCKYIHDILVRKGHSVHRDRRKQTRQELKTQLRKEY